MKYFIHLEIFLSHNHDENKKNSVVDIPRKATEKLHECFSQLPRHSERTVQLRLLHFY